MDLLNKKEILPVCFSGLVKYLIIQQDALSLNWLGIWSQFPSLHLESFPGVFNIHEIKNIRVH